MRSTFFSSILLMTLSALSASAAKIALKKQAEPSPLDAYIQEALTRQPSFSVAPTAGSMWSPSSRLTDAGSDVRAFQVDDMVMIVVNEQASAIATGTTKNARTSTLKSSVSSLAGPKAATSALNNLAAVNTASALDGSGTTSRDTQLTTTLSARVTHVLPNGYLVLEGNKDVLVNSEHQQISVRGVIRPMDLTPGNVIGSNQVAQMEIKINGKGVVGDAIRRPFILYRLLLGILPF